MEIFRNRVEFSENVSQKIEQVSLGDRIICGEVTSSLAAVLYAGAILFFVSIPVFIRLRHMSATFISSSDVPLTGHPERAAGKVENATM